MIDIRLFASLREVAGRDRLFLQVAEGATVEDVFVQLSRQFPQMAAYRPLLLVAVNQEYSDWQTMVKDGDEVALFPPVSGG